MIADQNLDEVLANLAGDVSEDHLRWCSAAGATVRIAAEALLLPEREREY